MEQVIEARGIRQLAIFDRIVLSAKSKETFLCVKEVGLQLLPKDTNSQDVVFVMVGDSLHRDVKLGNQAGFVTVYKPAEFLGVETPNESDEQPHYIIQNLGELVSLLPLIVASARRE